MKKHNKTDHDIIIEYTNEYLSKMRCSCANWLRTSLLPSLISHGLYRDDNLTGNQFYTFFRSLERRVIRYLDSGSFPEDWRYAWIEALDDDHASKVRAVLVQRLLNHGSSDDTDIQQPALLDRVTDSISEILRNAEPAYDGKYDDNDDPAKLRSLSISLTELRIAADLEIKKINIVRNKS